MGLRSSVGWQADPKDRAGEDEKPDPGLRRIELPGEIHSSRHPLPGQFCYIDAYTEPFVPPDWPPPGRAETREEMIERMRNTPTHLCRLRYFGDEEAWSFAFYTYSHERYEPAIFPTGSWHGTPEEAFQCSSIYLNG